LEEWQQAGWSLQKIVVMALLLLNTSQPSTLRPGGTGEQTQIVAELRHLLEYMHDETMGSLEMTQQLLYELQDRLAQMGRLPTTTMPEDDPGSEPSVAASTSERLSDEFLISLKKNRKPGIHMDE
jgi:hypothetical protein